MNSTNSNKRFKPSTVVVIYKTDQTYKPDYYLEKRAVEYQNGKFVLGAAVPMADEVMMDVAKAYMTLNVTDMDFGGMIASHILFASNAPGKTVIVWYRPAMKRKLNFASSLKVKDDVTVNLPATLYAILNRDMYVFALKSADRPDLKTPLFNAPFFNIYKDGKICLGSAAVGSHKAKTFELEAERFERGFYLAEQTMTHNDGCKTKLTELWPKLVGKKTPFPVSELIQNTTHKTLGELITKLTTKK